MTVVTNPGGVPNTWVSLLCIVNGIPQFVNVTIQKPDGDDYEVKKLTGGPRYCRTCEKFKPPRAHHCRQCHRYVPRMQVYQLLINSGYVYAVVSYAWVITVSLAHPHESENAFNQLLSQIITVPGSTIVSDISIMHISFDFWST
jgi:ribosomal protein L40E